MQRQKRIGWLLIGLSWGCLYVLGCRSDNTQTPTAPAPSGLSGSQLARTHCGSCHLFPAPALLDKQTWQTGVLPQMALRMGQAPEQTFRQLSEISDADELKRIIQAGIFPEQPRLHPTDWQKIVDYYVQAAPDSLPKSAQQYVANKGFSRFRAETVAQAPDSRLTLLRYDSLRHNLIVGTARNEWVRFDKQLKRIDSARLSSPAVDWHATPTGGRLLQVGVLNPNDREAGCWADLTKTSHRVLPLIRNLNRPVQASEADINHDGREDVIICEFGHYVGRIAWHEQTPTGYKPHQIEALPGARQTIVCDVNADGWPDLLALLTQGDEQVSLYINKKDGTFQKTVLLRFPPVYGSSYIEWMDMDGDGRHDIVYTNGDNADFSRIPKPYHGVRIFRNEGSYTFRETVFLPLYGATQTQTRDFDQDGDLDIAAIAHYANFQENPNAGFVFFENNGNGTFSAYTLPETQNGRWLLMEAADVDQDGDLDLLLGSFFRPTGRNLNRLLEKWQQPHAGLLLLRNQHVTAHTSPKR